MKQLINVLLLILAPLFLLGQTNELATPKWMIKTSPLSLIDVFGNTSAVVSIEVKRRKSTSIEIGAGIFYHSLGYGLQNNRGWRSAIELRHYFKQQNDRYLAINLAYKNQSYEFIESIQIGNSDPYEKQNAYHKKVTTLNVLYGLQKITLNKRFFLNPYVGVGLRYKQVTASGLTQEERQARDYGDSSVLLYMNSLEQKLYPNLALGFKIGWVLN